MDRYSLPYSTTLLKVVCSILISCTHAWSDNNSFSLISAAKKPPSTARILDKNQSTKVFRILHQLLGDDITSYLGYFPSIQLVSSELPNAFTTKSQKQVVIYLTSGLFAQLSDDEEYAFVLAHELGHIQLGHFDMMHAGGTHSQSLDLAANWEYQADQYAANLLKQSGYQPCYAYRLLQRLIENKDFKASYPLLSTSTLPSRIIHLESWLSTQCY